MTAGADRGGGGVHSDRTLVVAPDGAGQALGGFLRQTLGGSWNEVRRLIESGKVFIDGARVTGAGRRVAPGQRVEVRMRAPRASDRPEVRIVHEDPQVVVIDKPAGVSTVPFDPRETGTAMDLLRDAWRRQGRRASQVALHVVHRIDKDTSGLVMFAKSKRAEIALGAQFRAHTVERSYLCLAEGRVTPGRIESYLLRDRGDGLRGSRRGGRGGRGGPTGKRAVTHVEVLELLPRATLCRVRLETGRTHQNPHPPGRARQPAGGRDGLHPRPVARRPDAPRGSPAVPARRAPGLRAPGDPRPPPLRERRGQPRCNRVPARRRAAGGGRLSAGGG